MRIKKTHSVTIATLLCLTAGLAIATSSSADSRSGAKTVTFNKDVASILFKSCAECHRPGEAAPMSLLSYKDARPWAKAIREKVVTKQMPRWDADPHYGEFANDRRLSQAEIDTIISWVDSGAKEGEAKDLPPAPKFVEGWTIGKPDLVLTMPEEFTLDATGPDEYQYFEIPTGFTEDKYVQAVEARPGNRKIVHHIIAFIRSPRKDGKPLAKFKDEAPDKDSMQYKEGFLRRTKMDAAVYDDGCAIPKEELQKRRGQGQEGTGEWLIGYAPGNIVQPWEPGTVKKIPAGSSIVFQVHYSKVAGSVQKDRSSVGLIFAKGQPDKQVFMAGAANPYFQIPPGAEHHKVTSCFTTKDDIHVLSLTPHMHPRGAAMRFRPSIPTAAPRRCSTSPPTASPGRSLTSSRNLSRSRRGPSSW